MSKTWHLFTFPKIHFCHLDKTTNFQNRKSKHGLLNNFFVTVFRVKFRKHVKYPASSKRILNLFIWKKWVYSKTSKFVDWVKKFEKEAKYPSFNFETNIFEYFLGTCCCLPPLVYYAIFIYIYHLLYQYLSSTRKLETNY